jgi:hypothetical protein
MMLAETRKKQEEKADAASEAEPAPHEGRGVTETDFEGRAERAKHTSCR